MALPLVDPGGPPAARPFYRIKPAGIDALDACGIAESHGVKVTAIDGARTSRPTTVLADLTVGVSEASAEAARQAMAAAGVTRRSSAIDPRAGTLSNES